MGGVGIDASVNDRGRRERECEEEMEGGRLKENIDK